MIGPGRRVVVVVPAFEEEALVGRVLATMPAFVDAVVVIDDGSGDRTAEVVREAAQRDRRLRLFRHDARRGVGAAIASGYRLALAETRHPEDVIAVMAGDGQMDPADLERVVGPIVRGETDYVKGDRFRDATTRRSMGWPRFVGGHVFSRLTALAIGQHVSDSQCGYTAISRRAASAIDLDGLWPSFGYPNDLLGQLAMRDLRITEVPVRAVYGAERSKLRLRHLPPIFFLVARAAVRRHRARHPNEEESCVRAVPYHPERHIGCEPPGPRPVRIEEASER